MTFDGQRLVASGAWANATYQAVSGRPDTNGKFIYTSERQKLTGAGCIDLSIFMNNFVKDLKSFLDGVPNCYIPLKVSYA